ncbi:LysR substrate-binding domain-containing protein [Gluconacetobacter tumulisoli]|uniref:LysR family transcriptional regulator n=1 Tax=Gluconacetobacter tumulisoli TaxID=1286189 RepID=A0A7W4K6S5_9PROT|nr:LysR substrate-binding domain-containing protein [Gluconacetobacter tumulisoli]MBB2201409.1 LysR family transcriptional regulator [Gluconacetobacter tumulisoli]
MKKRLSLPPFGALRAFDAYGRTGGVRKAAEHLGVSHTIVGRHLRTLEDWVGVALIDRASGTLTPKGNSYHQDVAEALNSLSRATEKLRPQMDTSIRISCVSGFASLWLAGRVGAFRRSDPSINLVVRPFDRFPDFDRDDLHADIRYLRDEELLSFPAGFKKVQLARPPMFPVTSPAFAAEVMARVRTLADLLAEPLIEAEDSQEWHIFLSGHMVSPTGFVPFGRLGHASITLAAARHGQGISLANIFLVSDDLEHGTLVKVTMPDQAFRNVFIGAYYLIAPETSWNRPQFVRFRNWLMAEVRSFSARHMA